ncbi:MAG: hypothetical protein ABJI69_10315 [Balneola sp.]
MPEVVFDILITIAEGLLLTLILFLLNEYVFLKKNLSGEWKIKLIIDETSYNPFKDLSIYYKVHLLQKGYELSGSGEKVKEINSQNEVTEYEKDKRVTIDINGYYERKYLNRSIIYLNIVEKGRIRESRATYTLKIKNKKLLKGTFITTAADSQGKIKMKKK